MRLHMASQCQVTKWPSADKNTVVIHGARKQWTIQHTQGPELSIPRTQGPKWTKHGPLWFTWSPGYLLGPQFTPLQSDARRWAARVWTLGFEARHPRGAAVTAVVMAELVELVELGSIGPSCRCDTMWSMCAMYCLILTWYLVSPLQL